MPGNRGHKDHRLISRLRDPRECPGVGRAQIAFRTKFWGGGAKRQSIAILNEVCKKLPADLRTSADVTLRTQAEECTVHCSGLGHLHFGNVQ